MPFPGASRPEFILESNSSFETEGGVVGVQYALVSRRFFVCPHDSIRVPFAETAVFAPRYPYLGDLTIKCNSYHETPEPDSRVFPVCGTHEVPCHSPHGSLSVDYDAKFRLRVDC